MKDMLKYVVGIVAFVLLAVIGYYAWDAFASLPKEEQTPATEEPVMMHYATTTFSVEYPSDFTVNTAYQYTGVPGKPVDGVKFAVPETMTAKTNLSGDSGVSVEWLPRAKNCTGDIYVLDNVKAFEVGTASTTYSAASTTDAGAGNRYEEQIFAIPGSKPCTAVRYFIHYAAIENFPSEGEEGAVQEFDRAALLRAFDAIRDSLLLSQ